MKAMRIIILLSLLLVIKHYSLHAENNTQQDQNLQAIVDFDKTLDHATPSQFAAQSFKGAIASQDAQNDAATKEMRERNNENTSKTSIFQQSFVKYVREIYNQRNYAQALSQDGSHVVQFMQISNEMSLGPEIVYVCIRLFYNKMKACELVDDIVVAQLLHTVPPLIERHFAEDTSRHNYDLTFIKKQLENTLLNKFTNHLTEFSQQPDVFLSQLAQELTALYEQEMEAAKKDAQRADVRQRLRTMVIRFFDTIINRAIWQIQAPETIWRSFNDIAAGIQVLGLHNVINHMDDLDDLLWSLTHRFCFFLDLAGSALPSSLYDAIEKDLESRSVFFLEFKEQDEGITTKKETLAEAVLKAKTKAIAYNKQGIISTPMS